MKRFILLLLILSFSYFMKAQDSQYFYKRTQGETAEQFVNKHYDSEDYGYAHQVIEGYWGDESKGKKIMVVLDSPILEEYDKATLLVFQPVGDGENYILIPSNELGEVGAYMSTILSMFYYDLDDDGIKELFIIERGEVRVNVVLEGEDENGEAMEYETTACCEDVYETAIFQQRKSYTNSYLPIIENISYSSKFKDLDLSDLKTADEVKAKIKAFKNKD